MDIKKLDGTVIYSGDAVSVKQLLEQAVFSNANLEGADLEGANLEWANLKGANLEGVIGIKAV